LRLFCIVIKQNIVKKKMVYNENVHKFLTKAMCLIGTL